MTKAIERIVAGYVTLKNRAALQEIRDHRQRLLHENRLRSAAGFHLEGLNSELQEEVDILDTALDGLQIDNAGAVN